MNDHIDFGVIGLKIDDELRFKQKPEIEFRVSSNPGHLIRYQDDSYCLYTIRALTKKLMNLDRFNDVLDVWDLWLYKGKTLRQIKRENEDLTYQGKLVQETI